MSEFMSDLKSGGTKVQHHQVVRALCVEAGSRAKQWSAVVDNRFFDFLALRSNVDSSCCLVVIRSNRRDVEGPSC